MRYLTTPEGANPLEHRAGQVAEYGAYTYDLVHSSWTCPRCGKPVAGAASMVIPLINYRRLRDLEASTKDAGEAAYEDSDLPECEVCGGEARLEYLDYHAYHSGLSADVVLRWVPGKGIERLLWDPAAGYRPMPKLSKDDEKRFTRDAIVRAAGAYRDADEDSEADEVLLEATRAIPDDPELLRFMPWLHRRGKFSVSGEIAQEYIKARSKDPRGHFWLGQIHVELVARGQWPLDKLKEAVKSFGKALSLDPDYADAQLGMVNVARLRGDENDARARLDALIARRPDHPEAQYTLGLMELDRDPGKALECFARGEKLQPRDPDYPRGCARALLALGRYQDAQLAAARAKQLAPGDGRVDELMLAAAAGAARQVN